MFGLKRFISSLVRGKKSICCFRLFVGFINFLRLFQASGETKKEKKTLSQDFSMIMISVFRYKFDITDISFAA